MARTIGVGVIGMGWMGAVHSRTWQQIPARFGASGPQTRLVICADEVAKRAEQARRQFGFERCGTDWRQVIDDPQVDVVVVTAPNHLHLPIVKAVVGAGKHVFCEKPVGRSPDQTAQIEQAARKAGVLTCVGYNYRWAPVVQHARKLIGAGRLGTLTHYRGRFLVGYGRNPNSVLSWRFQRETAGLGVLGDLMSHVIDMSHMLAGPIRRLVSNQHTFIQQRPLATPGEGTHFTVAAGGPMGQVTNEDYVGALVQWAGGAHGTLEVCRIVNGPQCEFAFEVNGTEGALSWNFERMNELNLFLPQGDTGAHEGYTNIQARPEHPLYSYFNPGPATSLSYEDLKLIEDYQFATAIAAGRQGEPGFAEALAVATVQRAMECSWESDGWQEVRPLDPDGAASAT